MANFKEFNDYFTFQFTDYFKDAKSTNPNPPTPSQFHQSVRFSKPSTVKHGYNEVPGTGDFTSF